MAKEKDEKPITPLRSRFDLWWSKLNTKQKDDWAYKNNNWKEWGILFMIYFFVVIIICSVGVHWFTTEVTDITDEKISRTHIMADELCNTLNETYLSYRLSNGFIIVECEETNFKIKNKVECE